MIDAPTPMACRTHITPGPFKKVLVGVARYRGGVRLR
jgi:hypothetical protein